ncbi:MAG: thiamine pyrophosphate-binding protein [Actinobacteria bacterium]|nr:MAG: thiamine pyrophosphate-binding protein [Actinomycetota bacterium]
MAHLSGRDQFFDVARSEGARYLFANPGTTELPIFDELADETGIELILALQEATAVAAADGYAQATRRPALVNLHIAPGVANGLGNIFNAMWNRSPVVVTAGQQNTNQLIQEPMLAADLVRMTEQFCKWSYEVERPEDIGIAMRRAFKVAASSPHGPVFLSIPWNYLDEQTDTDVPPPSSIDHGTVAVDGIEQAARRLLDAKQPLIVAGDEVARAGAVNDLVALAEAVGARVVGEVLHSRMVFPMDHPLWSGMLPPVNAGIRSVLEQADVALVVGAVMFPPFFYNPVGAVPPNVDIIQIDPDPYQIAKTYPVALGLRGDAGATVRALLAEVRAQLSDDRRAALAERVKGYGEARAGAVAGMKAAVEAQMQMDPVSSFAACAAIADAFDTPTSVVDESVTATAAVRAALRQRDPDSYFFFKGGGLGWGIPASAGVQLAQPDRKVVAIVGDGATCYVPQSLWTLAHHDLPVTVVVLNNGGYYILKSQLLGMNQKAVKFDKWPGMDIADPSVDFMSLASAFGVPSERVEKGSEITSAVRKAMGSGGPFLLEVPIDGTIKPMG